MGKNIFDFAQFNNAESENQDNLNVNNNSNFNNCGEFNNLNKNQENNINGFNFNNNEELHNSNFNKNQSNLKQEATELFNKYKNFSKQDLLNEFLTTSKQKMKDGLLNDEQINFTVNQISPFLNSNQKDFLMELINKIHE